MDETQMNKQKFVDNSWDVFGRRKMMDKYDHEANSRGCKIIDYDKYHRQYKIEMMLLLSVLIFYFAVGFIIGLVAMVSYIYHI
jgi:hypothetical protein